MVRIDLYPQSKLQRITKKDVMEAVKRPSKKICFAKYNEHLPKHTNHKPNNFYGTINLPFGDGLIAKIFPYPLFPNKNTKKSGHVWLGIENEAMFEKIKRWCKAREEYVYIKDCLSGSAALSYNKPDNLSNKYTSVGALVNDCKNTYNEDAISQLVGRIMKFIEKHPPYQNCNFITAVPAANKNYDLPTTLVSIISDRLKMENLTYRFSFQGSKQSVKTVIDNDDFFEQKWKIWENAQISYNGSNLANSSILIIDDNYQSGI
mgnify:CR=1 FL=1